MGSSLKSGTRGDSTMTLSMKLPATVTPLSRDARVTVVLLFIVWLVDYFDRLIMNFALPYIGKDFQLNHTQKGCWYRPSSSRMRSRSCLAEFWRTGLVRERRLRSR